MLFNVADCLKNVLIYETDCSAIVCEILKWIIILIPQGIQTSIIIFVVLSTILLFMYFLALIKYIVHLVSYFILLF